ncbi:MAG: GTP cyclohydrolase I, partial [Gemmatimonadota bacterium]
MSDAKNIRSIVSPGTTGGPTVSQEAAEDHIYELLKFVGEDPDREGLLKTPERVVRALSFLTEGYEKDVDELFNNAFFSEE